MSNKNTDWRTEQKEVYDELVKKSPTGFQVIFTKEAIKNLEKIVPKGKILDLCCGTGHYAQFLKGREWYGLDISSESIKTASKFYKKANVADITKRIPYPDKSFENILALSFFHHIPNSIPDAVKEVKRVLKSNGVFTVIDHDARDSHQRSVTSNRLLRLTPTKSERCLYPDEVIKILKDGGFDIIEFAETRVDADQQALKQPFPIRVMKVLIMWALDIFGEKHQGDFYIKAKLKTRKR